MGEEGSGVGEKDTCCFTGHRPSKLPWGTREEDPRCVALKGRIAAALEEEYAAGVRHFISGMARGADLYFAEAVLALKERRPDVLLECARPCESQADRWPEEERARYQSILDRCDYETLVQHRYDRFCMGTWWTGPPGCWPSTTASPRAGPPRPWPTPCGKGSMSPY